MVVFDLGGVMVRIRRTWQECAEASGIRLNLPPDPPVYIWDLDPFNEYQAGGSQIRQYYVRLGELLGVSPEEAETLHASILREPYPGTLELMMDLHGQETQTAILSNTNEAHWVRMMDASRFPNIAGLGCKVASFEVMLEKPDPRIYRRFEEISARCPAELVFFDDTEANVISARECGWDAHLIDPHGDTAAQMNGVLCGIGVIRA